MCIYNSSEISLNRALSPEEEWSWPRHHHLHWEWLVQTECGLTCSRQLIMEKMTKGWTQLMFVCLPSERKDRVMIQHVLDDLSIRLTTKYSFFMAVSVFWLLCHQLSNFVNSREYLVLFYSGNMIIQVVHDFTVAFLVRAQLVFCRLKYAWKWTALSH